MKKRLMLLTLLLACVMMLCACQAPKEEFPMGVQTQNVYMGNTPEPAAEPEVDDIDFDDGSYDPLAEEEDGLEEIPAAPPVTVAPTVRSEYAGATPVVIDPIDKPTPTPVPPLTFTYQVYDATKLRLSFEAPVGWTVNDSASDAYVLTNPDPRVDYAASLTIQTLTTTSEYSISDLRAQAKQVLNTIAEGFTSFSGSSIEERKLLDKGGVYANYTAVLADGTKVAGRIHLTCINKTLYVLHVSYPQAYTETYKDGVYDKFRHTVTITQ